MYNTCISAHIYSIDLHTNTQIVYSPVRVQCCTCRVAPSVCRSLPTSLFSFRLPVFVRVRTRQNCDVDVHFDRVCFSEVVNADLYLSEFSGHVM